ncbi:MAG: BLUF domain-containing protein [Burkholderiales bacterium]|nr:BLUF domain-containing protein [Burkholderiales bacterium]
MIRRLACTSFPRTNLPATEVPRLIACSRTQNARDGISGVLIYTGYEFVQLVEGTPEAVERVRQRIRGDDRQSDVLIILDERDAERWFDDWRVGYFAERALTDMLAGWRALGRRLDDGERDSLRRLLAAADTL